eukprot:CAMPEP_0197309090 /NCGR_PEP_ID=MMETSP0891-20130614/7646_1 /TAXON_ID=44058 ORGANISM="Aureoumbra lagunensis, Strain CCMP1510" /NCGR_SAMPLE_ID=MMETSP0891 /ASSEMBLY_ACC=CAM_ASM_000534 /LENGTH=299 /DNA_ID=CAMNT_0042793967 /DNA_START=102 /DNA_END=998 /DNA_ORIENTATION=+
MIEGRWQEERARLLSGGPDDELQPLFNEVGSWLGADCATSIPGPGNGSYLWIFQDTIVGSIVNGMRNRECMPHNSVGIYTHGKLQHFLKGCDSFLTPLDPNRWYWTETGVVANDVFIFSQVMTLPCSIGCDQVAIALSRINVSANTLNASLWQMIETHNLPGFAQGIQWPTALFFMPNEIVGLFGRRTSTNTDGTVQTTAFLAQVPLATIIATPYSEVAWNQTLRFYLADGNWATIPTNQTVDALDIAPLFDDAPSETSIIRFPSGEKRFIVLNIPFATPYLQLRWSSPLNENEFPTNW